MHMSCKGSCKIGIMGGTFDPIHYGHLVLAEDIRTKFGLEMIYFVPVGQAPHKAAKELTDKYLRYAMTILATISNPNFEVSTVEVEKETISYTVDTIKEIKGIMDPDVELYFITGADAIMTIEDWKDFETLLSSCNIIGATRPGIEFQSLEKKVAHLREKYNAKIELTTIPGLAISSTDLRQRIKNGDSVKYLLPEAVESFIYKKNLYL